MPRTVRGETTCSDDRKAFAKVPARSILAPPAARDEPTRKATVRIGLSGLEICHRTRSTARGTTRSTATYTEARTLNIGLWGLPGMAAGLKWTSRAPEARDGTDRLSAPAGSLSGRTDGEGRGDSTRGQRRLVPLAGVSETDGPPIMIEPTGDTSTSARRPRHAAHPAATLCTATP